MIYEAILKGYNGETDETDHLIKWIEAPSIEDAIKGMKQQGWETDSPVLELQVEPDIDALDLIVE